MSDDEIRKEFEAWIGQDCSAWDLCWKDENIPGEYHYASTQQAWQAYRAGRNAALEAAAKACANEAGRHGDPDCVEACRSCADEVRALKEQSNG